MRSAFFCSTPYHIMTATAITMSEKLDADIYVIDEFSDSQKVVEGLKKSGVFNHVSVIPYTIDPRKCKGILSKINLYRRVLSLYLHTERNGKKYIGSRRYDRLYMFHFEHCYIQMFCVYFIRHFKGIRLFCYEDGNGSYYYPRIYDVHFLTRIYHWLFVGRTVSAKYFTIKVFSPKLYMIGHDDHPPITRVKKIQSLNSITGCQEKLFDIFNIKTDLKFPEKCIFLDTVRVEDLSAEGIEKLEHILKIISNDCELIIKDHPHRFHWSFIVIKMISVKDAFCLFFHLPRLLLKCSLIRNPLSSFCIRFLKPNCYIYMKMKWISIV